MTFGRLRNLLTFLVMVAFMAPIIAPVMDKAVGGDGRFIYFNAAILSADEILGPQSQVFDQHDGDVLDLDNDEQTPQDDHFNLMTMGLTPSFSLEMQLPKAAYVSLPSFELLSHISSPLARPPKTHA